MQIVVYKCRMYAVGINNAHLPFIAPNELI